MSLALSTLIYEWRRYLAAVVALAVAGLLVLALVGLFMGIGKAFTATIDRSPAQIMILPPAAESLFSSGGQPRRILPMIYQHPDVAEVVILDGNGSMWSNFPKDGEKVKREFVQVMVVDPVEGAATLPIDFPEDVTLGLQEPYSVVLDQSSLGRLGVKVGDNAKMNGKTVKVRAALTNYPNMAQPMVFMSRQTARMLKLTDEGTRIGPLLVRIKDPTRAEVVVEELNAMSNGQYRAWTREKLSAANEQTLLKDNFIGLLLGFCLVIGVFIGVVITWQTLQGAILANIKEFASLRALGVSMGTLRLIIMELSFWVGVAGLGLTAILTAGVAMLAQANGMPMSFPPFWVLLVAAMLLIISIVSGMLSLGILKKSQPADLLR